MHARQKKLYLGFYFKSVSCVAQAGLGFLGSWVTYLCHQSWLASNFSLCNSVQHPSSTVCSCWPRGIMVHIII